jgi:hypothetical protein
MAWHAMISSKTESGHGAPPPYAFSAMTLLRDDWPSPHVTAQALHEDHCPSLHGEDFSLQSSGNVGPKLQDWIWWIALLQGAPVPVPYSLMLRDRCFTPLHVHEQSLQLSHSPMMQSLFVAHDTVLQLLNSAVGP